MLDISSTASAIYVNSASLRAMQSFRNRPFPLFHVPLRQRQMTVMTSGSASQSSVQQFIQTDKKKHQRSALLSLCGGESTGDRWIPHTKGQ